MATIHKIGNNLIDPTGQRVFPHVKLETTLLVRMLQGRPEGTIVTYEEMGKEIGQSVKPPAPGYKYLRSAKRILIRDYSVVADAEPTVGVRICTNEEKMLVSGRDTKRSRRAAIASRQKLRAVAYDALDDAKKSEWNARMSVLGVLELLSAPRALTKVIKAIGDHPLPSIKTLDLFR